MSPEQHAEALAEATAAEDAAWEAYRAVWIGGRYSKAAVQAHYAAIQASCVREDLEQGS